MLDTKSQNKAGPVIAILFTDLVGSVELKSRLGNKGYGALIKRHDQIFHSIVETIPGGKVIQDTGDGFFASFGTAADAAGAALAFQAALNREPWKEATPQVRIGIHIGQVEAVGDYGRGEKLVGLAPDIAARIMGLAQGGQILLSRHAFDDARQYLHELPVALAEQDLRWIAHGRYLLKYYDEPLEVYEVGVREFSPLKPPPDSEKAKRVIGPDEAELLGWRPAAGQDIPGNTEWQLGHKLGEGGVGEVWVAKQKKLGTRHVFKFCFDPERLRSLKRELTLFRLIRNTLGEREDIVPLYDVHLDTPPYYLESAFSEAGDLNGWSGDNGGIGKFPLEDRLGIIARIASAAAAAHSVGVLHKDIKPSNVLIKSSASGEIIPMLADFGIGELADASRLEQAGITLTGFTQMVGDADRISGSGTPIYVPPESLAGHPFTIQGDIYALGVMLYQVIIGDLERPLGQGWQRDIDDEILIEDVSRCVDGDPARRFSSAQELAERLENLQQRREKIREEQRVAQRNLRRKRIVHVGIVVGLLLLLATAVVSLGLIREQGLRQLAEAEAENARLAELKTRKVYEYLHGMLGSANPASAQDKDLTVIQMLDDAAARLETDNTFSGDPAVEAAVRQTLGATYSSLGQFTSAEHQLTVALGLMQKAHGSDSQEALSISTDIARLYLLSGRVDEVQDMLRQTLAAQQRKLGTGARDTIATMRLLGVMHAELSELKEAKVVYSEALALAEEHLGPDDPETLSLLNNLLATRVSLGDRQGMEEMYLQLIERQERVRGPTNPHTLETRQSLAVFYATNNRYEEAERQLLDVTSQVNDIFGDAHRSALVAHTYLGEVQAKLGKLKQAEAVLTETDRLYLDAFGPDDAWRLYNAVLLAGVYLQQEKVEQAGMLAEEVIGRQRATLGDTHLDTLITAATLAGIRNRQERYREAEKLSHQVITGFGAIVGDDNAALIEPNHMLLLSMIGQGEISDARPVALKIKRLMEQDTGIAADKREQILQDVAQVLGD